MTPYPPKSQPVTGPWQEMGACRGVDNAAFFPHEDRVPIRARKLCDTCAVSEECLEHALRNPSEFGVWGGTTYKERNAIRRGRERRSA